MAETKYYKGIDVTYYMNNGTVIKDRIEFGQACREDDKELIKLLKEIRQMAQAIGKSATGTWSLGDMFLDVQQIDAVKFSGVEAGM